MQFFKIVQYFFFTVLLQVMYITDSMRTDNMSMMKPSIRTNKGTTSIRRQAKVTNLDRQDNESLINQEKVAY